MKLGDLLPLGIKVGHGASESPGLVEFSWHETSEAEALAKFPDDARGDAAVSVGEEVLLG